MYFGLEMIQEYVCGGDYVSCEAGPALIREFVHGDPERYPEAVAMLTYMHELHGVPPGEPPLPATPHFVEAYHYLHDALGSVIGLVDEDGTLVERYTYDPYGKVFIETWDPAANGGSGAFVPAETYCGLGATACGKMPYSPTGNPFLWTGHRYDAAVGLYHTLFRFYDLVMGRWLQRDPIEYDGGSINLYELVRSDPLGWIDPFGLQPGPRAPVPDRVPPPEGWPDNMDWDGEKWTWREGEGNVRHRGHYDSKSRRLYVSPDGKTVEIEIKRLGPKSRSKITARMMKRLRVAAGVTAVGSAILLGLLTQYADALDHFADENKSRSCYAWMQAAMKGDCESMRHHQDSCRDDLAAAGLDKAAMGFDLFANKAYDECLTRKEKKKEEEAKSCPGS